MAKRKLFGQRAQESVVFAFRDPAIVAARASTQGIWAKRRGKHVMVFVVPNEESSTFGSAAGASGPS